MAAAARSSTTRSTYYNDVPPDHARGLLDNDTEAPRHPSSTHLQYAPYLCDHQSLMASVNPAFMARQLDHSLEMFFKVYTKWIDDQHDERELAKI